MFTISIDIDFLCEYLSNNRQNSVFGVSVLFSVAGSSQGKWQPWCSPNIWPTVTLVPVPLSFSWSRHCFHIKQSICQKTSNELPCNDLRKHSVSASATATVKIKLIWRTAGSKMFYVLWRIYTSWGRCGKLLMTCVVCIHTYIYIYIYIYIYMYYIFYLLNVRKKNYN